MQDARSRITVVGERKRLDVAVPSDAPIGEYVGGLAQLCGQPRAAVLPPAWSLARPEAAPLPLGVSLAEAGVVDGQVLYLRDVASDPAHELAVEDVEEQVMGAAFARLRTNWPRGIVVTMAGLLWVVATGVVPSIAHEVSPVAWAISLACAGVLLLTTAWALESQRSRVPAWLCLAMSLTSIPCLGGAGALLARELAGPSFVWVGVVAGCNAATLLTLVATPEAVVFTLELQFAAAALLAPVLLAVRANAVQTAAAVAAVALVAVVTEKTVAATITLFVRRVRRERTSMAQATTELLVRSQQIVPVVTAIPVIALAVTLPILAHSGQLFAVLLALTASVALLSRARQAVLTTEAVLLGSAGIVGTFGLLSALLATHAREWWMAALLVGAGMALVAGGVAATTMRDPDQPPPGLVGAGGPPRRQTLDVVGLVCAVLSAPLALGALGIFAELAARGRELVS